MLPARRYPNILCLTANEKDFSLSLEMTIWGNSRILVSQPSPLGKGDRAAVDRVLSYIVDLRRIFPLFFIPLVPYPARSARHLPHAGKVDRAAVDRVLSFIVDLRYIFPLSFIPLEPYPARFARHLPHAGKALSVDILFPHMRVFALTMREKRHSRIVAFPIGEGGPRSGG